MNHPNWRSPPCYENVMPNWPGGQDRSGSGRREHNASAAWWAGAARYYTNQH